MYFGHKVRNRGIFHLVAPIWKNVNWIFLRIFILIIFHNEQTYSYYDPNQYHKLCGLSCANIPTVPNYNNFPQFVISFDDTFPEECKYCIEASSALLALYSITNASNTTGGTMNAESFQTIVFSHVKKMDSLIRIAKSAEKNGLTSVLYKWIIFLHGEMQETTTIPELMNVISKLNFEITNPLLITQTQTFSKETDNVSNRKCLIMFNLSTVTFQKQIIVLERDCFETGLYHSHILTLGGSELNVAGVAHSLYNYDTKMYIDEMNGTIFESGFAVEVLRGLQYILNFSVNPILMTDWGSINSTTGEWAGMVGAAIRGEIDLAISSSNQNANRFPHVDYNLLTNKLTLAAFFKKYDGYPSNSLLLPFQTSLWVTVAMWICISRVVYIIFQHYIYTHLEQNRSNASKEEDLIPWIFVPITNRGKSKPPTSIALRTLYFTELIVAVILNTVYSGTLISYLSIEYNPINSIGDLVKSDYNIEILNYSVTKQGLKMSKDKVTKSLYWKSKQYERLDKSTVSPIKELMKGKFAYIIHNMAGFREIDQELHPVEACDLQYIPMNAQVYKQGSFVRKGSQLRKIIDFGLLKMMETGMTSSFKQRYLAPRLSCAQSKELPSVDNQDLQLAFSMLITVYITVPFICIIENIWFRIKLYYV